MTSTDVKSNKTEKVKLSKNTDDNILLLNNESDYVDEEEGFAKNSALGNVYNTNGKSNA
jgi:hypothetical protein